MRSFNFCFLAFVLSFLAFTPMAMASFFEVVRMKGKISVLQDGKEIKVSKGQKISHITQIRSGKSSFAKLLFNNGNILSLGPESVMNINHKIEDQPLVVSLVRGKLRAKVKKSVKNNKKYKMYLKTRSASIGVRGTDFLVSYNEKNHITSSLTFEGDVHLYKVPDSEIYESIQEDLDTHKHAIHIAEEQEVHLVETNLAHHSVKSIKRGEFSGAFPTYDSPIHPTRISPEQLEVLNSNKNLSTRKSLVYRPLNKSKKSKTLLTNKSLIPEPLEGMDLNAEEKESQHLQVRPGGHLDINTGIYISPPKDAEYNKVTKTYHVPENYGGFDGKSGHYIPPKGLELDHLKGLVVTDKKYESQYEHLLSSAHQFSEALTGTLNRFKEISRIDLMAYGDYRYSLKSMENYYGEFRNISNAETMIVDFAAKMGRHLFHNKRYRHYIKAKFNSIYHNRRDIDDVKRNDRLVMAYGYEFHRKHIISKHKANFIVDVNFETIYQDHQAKDSTSFYSESANFEVGESFRYNHRHKSSVFGKLTSFQGHVDNDHGNIWAGKFQHIWSMGTTNDFIFDAGYSNRVNKLDNEEYAITSLGVQLKSRDILRKTNMNISYDYQWHDPKLDTVFTEATYYATKFELVRRKGIYFQFNAFYSYSRQLAENSQSRSFIQQTWGVLTHNNGLLRRGMS
jgi:hypothetical protein